MAYATWLADVLTDAGLTIKPYPGWETRGGADFSPRGVILHHTVTRPSASDAAVDRLLAVRGSSRVSPPLCQYSTNRDGTVSVIAAGTANHGGVGRWNGVAGNRHWFGDEMKNLGTSAEPWPSRQVESALIAAAAVLAHIDADESWMCGHKEYATPPGRKVDPHTLNLNTLRTQVKHLMTKEDHMFIAADGRNGWPNKGPAVEYWQHFLRKLDPAYNPGVGGWGDATSREFAAELAKFSPGPAVIGPGEKLALEIQLAQKFATGGAHDHDGRYVKNVSVSR